MKMTMPVSCSHQLDVSLVQTKSSAGASPQSNSTPPRELLFEVRAVFNAQESSHMTLHLADLIMNLFLNEAR